MMTDLGAVTVLKNHSDLEGLPAGLLATPVPAGDDGVLPPLNVTYIVSEVLVAVVAIIGNALTITVFVVDRKVRRLTNYYIVSLALADLLVGVLGIPFAILTAVGLPRLLWPCLLMLSTLLMLCTISIFCLVAVSVDRYWAILHPLRYSRVMTAKIVRRVILACWVVGTLVGLMPSMGWYRYHDSCVFTEVMNYDYLLFLYFCTIVVPGLLMAFFYTHIYTVVLKQLRQIAAQEPQGGDNASIGTQSSQRQRSTIFRSQSRGQVSEGSSTRDDPRRASTNTNIIHQLPIPRSSKPCQSRRLHPNVDHSPSLHSSGFSDQQQDLQLSPYSLLRLPQSGGLHHHHKDSDLHQHHHQEENLHHYLLRLHFEGALRKSYETLPAGNDRGSEGEEREAASRNGERDAIGSRRDMRDHIPFHNRSMMPSIRVESDIPQEEPPAGGAEATAAEDPSVRGTAGWKRLVKKIRSKKHEEFHCPHAGGAEGDDSRRGSALSHVLHQVTHPSRREVKAAKSLSIIVLFFMVSWFPLYTINCVQAFCTSCPVSEGLMFFTILLSHLNSAINPFLYAYHMKDFRNALKVFIWHRILRRPVELDCAFGRSLVLSHHSTVYRVNNMAGSPNITATHSPHALNTTPATATPLHGTPLEDLKPGPSAAGRRHNPWYPSRGMSPSLSLPAASPPSVPSHSSEDDEDSPSSASRPRAATIASHTSPASARIAMDASPSPSRLLPPSGGPKKQQDAIAERRAVTLPPQPPSHCLALRVPSLGAFPDASANPNVTFTVDINQNTSDDAASGAAAVSPQTGATGGVPQRTDLADDGYDARDDRPYSGAWYVTARTSSTYSTHTGSSSLTNSETEYDGKGAHLSFPSKDSLNTSTSNRSLTFIENSESEGTYREGGVRKWSTTSICEGTEGKSELEESRQLLDQGEKDDTKSGEVLESSRGGVTPDCVEQVSTKILNGSVWDSAGVISEPNNSVPQGEEYISECDKPGFPCLGLVASGEPMSGKCREEELNYQTSEGKASEQEYFLKGLGKYFPHLPRRESGHRSKNLRKTKNWWSEMMRHRSYHGVSLSLKGSKYKKRAQSVSGAIET